jgi:hypothetical protein
MQSTDREARPLTPEELRLHHEEVEVSQTKEFKSWVDHSTCQAVSADKYFRDTGLLPLPSRWVIEFKIKEGKKVIKSRLVLKGFAETSQANLFTSSPTASRLGHRLVCLLAAANHWSLVSLDISTAFLQGWSFAEMSEAGFSRQPCAFRPPPEVWQLLAKLDPGQFEHAAKEPGKHVLQLHKAAYGLKDAHLSGCSESPAI